MIEIRIESSWDTDDGEGRSIEVTVTTRRRPTEDPQENTKYFAGGDLASLSAYVAQVLQQNADDFEGTDRSECSQCHQVRPEEELDAEKRCRSCPS